jgi:hypothetical protein
VAILGGFLGSRTSLVAGVQTLCGVAGKEPIRAGVVMPFVRRLFDESGTIKDEFYNARAEALIEQLLWWARALKAARASTSGSS